MEILSHRGYWNNDSEKNSVVAFERSFDSGYGTETDVRDYGSKIVICHDMPNGSELSLQDFLEIMNGRNLTLAINIKADGLALEIKRILSEYKHTNYFLFDMSLPEMVFQLKQGIPVFTGLSEYQPLPPLVDKCEGIWLDCFTGDWYGPALIKNWLSKGKKICLVSAELHKRNKDWQWAMLKENMLHKEKELFLCTDKPNEAKNFFNDGNIIK